jgi:N-acetylneuraminate synthase
MSAGHVLRRDDLTIKRPGTGIEPWRLGEMIGRRLARDVEGDVPLTEADLD